MSGNYVTHLLVQFMKLHLHRKLHNTKQQNMPNGAKFLKDSAVVVVNFSTCIHFEDIFLSRTFLFFFFLVSFCFSSGTTFECLSERCVVQNVFHIETFIRQSDIDRITVFGQCGPFCNLTITGRTPICRRQIGTHSTWGNVHLRGVPVLVGAVGRLEL